MRWRWRIKKARREERKKDTMRHYRVAQRLQARMEDASRCGDLERVKVLADRIHRVRDIQTAELGH